jgi:hypothetical protein
LWEYLGTDFLSYYIFLSEFLVILAFLPPLWCFAFAIVSDDAASQDALNGAAVELFEDLFSLLRGKRWLCVWTMLSP